MSNIDFAQTITAKQRAANAAFQRTEAIKADVRARIFSVVNQNTQASLLAAVVAGALSETDRVTFTHGQAWSEATKAEGRRVDEEGGEPVWPDVPEGVAELAERF